MRMLKDLHRCSSCMEIFIYEEVNKLQQFCDHSVIRVNVDIDSVLL